MKINIQFFEQDFKEAIGAGIYEITVKYQGKSEPLYIGESFSPLVRCSEHLYELQKDPHYFGFTKETIEYSAITLVFSIIEQNSDQILRRKTEKAIIKDRKPLSQSGISDYQKPIPGKIDALHQFLGIQSAMLQDIQKDQSVNSYYGELCTKVYESDKSLAEGKELEFYLSFADRKCMQVLQPMCGNGRLLIPFMQRGIEIEGFDISEEMLQVCREKGQRLSLKPNVQYAKIEDFVSPKKFDLIMIPFGSFSLLPDELVSASLQNLSHVLDEQGKLLLTVMIEQHPITELTEWTESGKTQLEHADIVMYKKATYDSEKAVLFTELKYELVREGTVVQTELMEFPVRLYGIESFQQTLEANGFQQIVVHEVEDGYGAGSSFHVFECSL